MSKIRLILGLEFRRFCNQYRYAKSQRKGMRLATSTKKKGSWFWPTLMTMMFLCFILFQFKMGTEKLITESYTDDFDDKIVVSDKDYFRVRFWAKTHADSKQSREEITQDLLKNSYIEVMEETAGRYVDNLIEYGEEGFISAAQLKNKLIISDFSSTDLKRLTSMLGIVLSGFLVFLILGPIAMRYKDLAAEDTQLEMLFGLPLENRTILVGRFLTMWFIRPTTVLVFGLLFMFYINSPLGWVSLLYALTGALSLSAIAASLELFVETVLRSKGTQRMKKNVQVFCLITGTMGMFLGFSLMVSQHSTVMTWLLNSGYGEVVYPLGKLFLLPVESGQGGFFMIGLLCLIAASVTALSLVFSARSLRSGLSAGGGMHAPRHLKAKEIKLTRKDEIGGQSGSSLKYEWLIILRDRALLTQMLILPLMLLAYNWMMNPQFLGELSLLNVCMIAYGVTIYGVFTSAGYLVTSELKSLWVIFTLPVSIAEFFRKRATLWGGMLSMFAAIIMCFMVVIFSIEMNEHVWRSIPCVLGVYILSRLLYAIMLGKVDLPDPAAAQVVKVNVGRLYLCMMLSGMCGYILYQGNPWNIFAWFTIIWFLGDSLWENLSSRLRYIFETMHDVPEQARLSDALRIILIYFIIQSGFMLLFSGFEGGVGLLVAFIAAGLVTVLICLAHEKFESIPKLTLYPAEKLRECSFLMQNRSHFTVLVVCVLVTTSIAILWLELVKVIPALNEHIPVPTMASNWYLFGLVVIAAPLIEEFIFRKILFRVMLQEWLLKKSIICSALIFAVIHPGVSFPPVFLLGLATAWIYVKSGQLRYSIILHGSYNAVIYMVQSGMVIGG